MKRHVAGLRAYYAHARVARRAEDRKIGGASYSVCRAAWGNMPSRHAAKRPAEKSSLYARPSHGVTNVVRLTSYARRRLVLMNAAQDV